MPTINSIIKELKNVPVDRLEDLYFIVHALRRDEKKTQTKTQEILSYAGEFAEIPESDYNNFVKQTKQTRAQLFDRNFNL